MNPISIFFVLYAVAMVLIIITFGMFHTFLKKTNIDFWSVWDFRKWYFIPAIHMNLHDVESSAKEGEWHSAIEMDFMLLCFSVHIILVELKPLKDVKKA